MAASIAYQAFISLLPLLVLVFFFVTLAGDEQFAAQVTETTEGVLPESGQLLIEESLEDSPATAGSTAIGVVVLLWGSLKIFRGLDTAFSEIYDTAAASSFLEQIRDALFVFGAIGGALVAAATAGIAFAVLPDVPGFGILQSLLLVGVLTAAFYPMYYFFPDVEVSKREVIPGVVIAALGWTALQSLFRVYVAIAADTEGSGAVGAILILLTWLYFGGLILLAGAVVNAVGTGYLEPGSDTDSNTSSQPVADTPAQTDREPFIDETARERMHLRNRIRTVETERNQLRLDRDAHRTRRYRLEDRVTTLEEQNHELQETNDRLRCELERHRLRDTEPMWRRLLETVGQRVTSVTIGSVERRE